MKNGRLRPKKKKRVAWGGRIKEREGRKGEKERESQSGREGVRGERGEETIIGKKTKMNKKREEK